MKAIVTLSAREITKVVRTYRTAEGVKPTKEMSSRGKCIYGKYIHAFR